MPPTPGGGDTPAARVTQRPGWTVPALVVALLALHVFLALSAANRECVTTDELAHITGGLSYWKQKDYRLQPENGNLPQRWEALPAWLSGVRFPSVEADGWARGDVWSVGHDLFYGGARDPAALLMEARAMAVLFSAALGLLIFAWSRHLFGAPAGLFSLGFYALSPDFLAHGPLATSDVCMALLLCASVGAYWRHLHDGRLRWAAASAAAFGLAWVAKFSVVTLPPVLAILALVRVFTPGPLRLLGRSAGTPAGRAVLIALSALLHAGGAWATIWAFYGFRFSAFNPALPGAHGFMMTWPQMEAGLGPVRPLVHGLLRLHALPEAWIYGLADVADTSGMRASFLNGDYGLYGWHSFFLWTFALKTTPALLCACAAAAAVFLLGRSRPARPWALTQIRSGAGAPGGAHLRDEYAVDPSVALGAWSRSPLLPLVVLFAVYAAFALGSHLDIGHRHILPLYPPLLIGIGLLAAPAAGPRPARRTAAVILLAGLLGWQAVDCVRIAPHFLAYFNAFAGGPAGGRFHLADSSLDWGQDLPGLKAWVDAHARPGEPVYLAYCGSGEPGACGLRVRPLAIVSGFHRFIPFGPMEPGLYCLGVTMLDQVYSPARGPWTAQKEAVYQKGRRLEPLFEEFSRERMGMPRWNRPRETDPLRQLSPADWAALIEEYRAYKLARLCTYLRVRQPDAEVGWSITIYRLDAAEIAAATASDLPTLEALVGQARGRAPSLSPTP